MPEHTPDVDYLRGAAEALAEVRRRLDITAEADEQLFVSTVHLILRDAAAGLGVDEDAPSSRAVSPEAASGPSGVPGSGSDGSRPAEIASGRFAIEALGAHGYDARIYNHCNKCGWESEGDWEEPIDLAELVQRAGEHAEVCK